MKKLILTLLLLTALNLYPVETVVIKDSECHDYLKILEKNDVLFYQVTAVDADENNRLYFLAHKLCTILRIDYKTGKLVNTIGSKGQGPGELDVATAIRVVNGKVFVADRVFGGVKIFGVEGSLIKEFRTHPYISWLDVNANEEIFAKESEPDATPVIAVYNKDGKRLKTLIRFPYTGSPDRLKISILKHFVFRVDGLGNIFVLNNTERTLQKYDRKGRMLWEKPIINEILEKYLHREKKSYRDRLGNIRRRTIVRNFMDIDKKNHIIIGHAGGGVILDNNGNNYKLIKFESPLKILHLLKLFDNDSKLMNLMVAGDIIDVLDYTRLK